ncbi:MAG: hypothetical protein ACTSWX_01690 [Promethearchaeota archaeon]
MIKMIPNVNVELLRENIKKFKELEHPDADLVRNILTSLGIYDIVELEVCLNLHIKRERDAAMKMLERHLDDLISGDHERWADAKDTLMQIYYQVESSDEEALL